MPEIIDPVFVKTSPIRSFSMTENKRFVLVFTKTRVYKFGHRVREKVIAKGLFLGYNVTTAIHAVRRSSAEPGLCCLVVLRRKGVGIRRVS